MLSVVYPFHSTSQEIWSWHVTGQVLSQSHYITVYKFNIQVTGDRNDDRRRLGLFCFSISFDSQWNIKKCEGFLLFSQSFSPFYTLFQVKLVMFE